MGGTITAESTPGRGSSFSFEVALAPRWPPRRFPGRSRPERAIAPAWSSAPLVLIAEDSQINQIVATRVLERCGCRVKVVGDGAEALRALAAERFDAVLMDCQMPGMDGYEATTELRQREQGARHTPVIAMTAHAMAGDRERCISAGMDDYISKPVRHTDLADMLRRWIRRTASKPADRRSAKATRVRATEQLTRRPAHCFPKPETSAGRSGLSDFIGGLGVFPRAIQDALPV